MVLRQATGIKFQLWAKDGNWLLAYTGTIAFIVNKDVVKDIPKTWQDLLKGNYKITVGDVSIALKL